MYFKVCYTNPKFQVILLLVSKKYSVVRFENRHFNIKVSLKCIFSQFIGHKWLKSIFFQKIQKHLVYFKVLCKNPNFQVILPLSFREILQFVKPTLPYKSVVEMYFSQFFGLNSAKIQYFSKIKKYVVYFRVIYKNPKFQVILSFSFQ